MSMDATAHSFAASWPAVPECSPVARHSLTAHLREAGVDEDQLADIALVVSEGISNVINHAYVGIPTGDFWLTAEISDADELRVTVADEGTGMRPRPDTPGLGLGLPLIASLAESFDVQSRSTGGTFLSVCFRLQRSGLAES